MNKENINRLKKYLFLISIFFVSLIGSHITYTYLYSNSIQKPIEGGSISEGVIGDFPHLNPLKYSESYNKDIINMLYRSLAKYDYETNTIVSDLADCNIENLAYIECSLKQNYRSDGSKITTDDVLATYNIIQNSDVNSYISGLLKNTTISIINNNITFISEIKDINIINALFQPIVPKNTIDNIGNKELFGSFNPFDGIYSGAYKVDTVSYDDTLGIQKLFLVKNDYYNDETDKTVYISKYVFKFFKDIAHFNKHKDNINIYHENNYTLGEISPRMNTYFFSPNQYLSVFINKDNIENNDLRNILLNSIDRDTILNKLGIGYSKIYNPYILGSTGTVSKSQNLNIESILNDQGYYKKSYLIESGLSKLKTDFINELQEKNTTKIQTFSSGITHNYTFTTTDILTMKGEVEGKEFDEIYVNDAKLWIPKNAKDFSYTLSLENGNIKEGENNYKIYYKVGDEKKLIEEFKVIYEPSEEELNAYEEKLVLSSASTEETLEYNNKVKELQDKLESLEENGYYNEDLEPLELRFYYIEGQSDVIAISEVIKSSIETYGIKVNAIPITSSELTKKVQDGEKDYDLILIGIDIGTISSNIFPYFHSSQSANGYNLSNIKDSDLDDLLEKLKAQIYNKDEANELEGEVIDILKENNVVKTLYNKNYVIYYDKNINNLNLDDNITNIQAFYDKLKFANINSEKSINYEDKGLFDFINFIKEIFKNDNTL